MRHTLGVVLFSAMTGLGLAMIAVYSSCGGTGGGTDPSQSTGQVVSQSCGPLGPKGGGNCLSLSAPNAVPADGATISLFRAILVDGSGNPLEGVQICFRFEDARVATITEPTDGCGLTGSDGHVSGQFRDGTQPGSFDLIADAPPGFELEARREISFDPVPLPTSTRAAATPTPTPTPLPAGSVCTRSSQCVDGNRCSGTFPGCSGAGCCTRSPGDPCAADAACDSNSCVAGSCA